MVHTKTTLSDRLKRVRIEFDYAQKRMAESVGSKLRSWQDYEKGNKVPGSQVIAGLSEIGVNANWLLTGNGPMLIKDLQHTAPAGALDPSLLQTVIEGVETALQQTGRTMQPANKAELIMAVYDLYDGIEQKPDTAKILKLVKSAA